MYKVEKGKSFISNGVIYSEGDEIAEKDFATKEVFERFVNDGKIIKKIESKSEKGETTANSLEKKVKGLKTTYETAKRNLEAKPGDEKLTQKLQAVSANLQAAEAELLQFQEGGE